MCYPHNNRTGCLYNHQNNSCWNTSSVPLSIEFPWTICCCLSSFLSKLIIQSFYINPIYVQCPPYGSKLMRRRCERARRVLHSLYQVTFAWENITEERRCPQYNSEKLYCHDRAVHSLQFTVYSQDLRLKVKERYNKNESVILIIV